MKSANFSYIYLAFIYFYFQLYLLRCLLYDFSALLPEYKFSTFCTQPSSTFIQYFFINNFYKNETLFVFVTGDDVVKASAKYENFGNMAPDWCSENMLHGSKGSRRSAEKSTSKICRRRRHGTLFHTRRYGSRLHSIQIESHRPRRPKCLL